MKWTREGSTGAGGTGNEAIAAQIAAAYRRRVWKIVIIANVVALVAAIGGCLFMMRSHGVKADVAKMRDEVGETLTMMTLGDSNEAVAKYLPRLIDKTVKWGRAFDGKREEFRGLDVEINHVQSMRRLKVRAEVWHKEISDVPREQRDAFWQKNLKAQVEAEQKMWPNRTARRSAGGWLVEMWKEVWFGMRHGLTWPQGVYERTRELIKFGWGVRDMGVGDRLRYILFPYRLSAFTMLRLLGIALATSGIGYLMCWLGLRSRFAWLSYVGLLYFLYLLNIALFIVWLEVTK